MSRFAVALTAALALALVIAGFGATPAMADTPPVTIVNCFVTDDGAGFTSAQVQDGFADQHNGAHPTNPGCNGGASAAPANSMANGACAAMSPDQCSASSSASASANTTSSTTSTGASITGTATGTASAATSGPGAQVDASGEQSIGGRVQFKVNVASTFTISGSASSTGQNNNSAVAQVELLGPPTPVFSLLTGTNSMTGSLAPGTYSVGTFVDARARANFNSVDPSASSGHSQVDASFTLTIKQGSSCPTTAVPSVQIGNAQAEGCFTERQDAQGHGTGVFETDQEAWIGGFDLKPQAGAKLVIEPSNVTSPIRSEGGGVDWVLSDSISTPALLGQIKPFTTTFDYLDLNTEGTLERLLQIPLFKGASAQVKVTWSPGGGGSTVDSQFSIADIGKNVGTVVSETTGHSVGTLGGTVSFTQSNNSRIDLTSASVQIPEFAEELKDTDPPLKLGFGGGKFSYSKDSQGNVTWSGEVTTQFPFQKRQGSIKGTLAITNEALGTLGLDVQGFEEPIGDTGWDWTGAHGSIGFAPDFAFDLGMNAQTHAEPGVPVLLKASGSGKLFHLAAECKNGKNPLELLGTLSAPILESLNIGTLTGQLTYCGYMQGLADFAFEAGLSAKLTVNVGSAKSLVTADGSATGWFQGTGDRFHSTAFNLDGTFNLNLPVIGKIGGKGLISSEGYAFCATFHGVSFGFGTNNWTDAPDELLSCDFTPFRAPPPAAADAAAGGTRTVSVPDGQRMFALAVRGLSAAPRVRVAGPGHQRFLTPTGAKVLTAPGALIVPVDQLRTTYVYLRNPRGGKWALTPMPGSTAVTGVDSARLLPKPHVTAVVKPLHSGKVRLSWHADAIAGQRLQLLDRAAGVATLIQPLTAKHSGTVTFKPANPLAGRRSIEADVFQNGRPRAQLTALHYRLHVAARPGRVTHATATRGGAGLSIAWHRATHARTYLVTVTSGTDTIAATDTSKTSLVLPSPPAGPLSVQITPRDGFGRNGPATTLRVA